MGRYTRNTMQGQPPHISEKNHDDASAEMIGSIILIGIFVAAFGIVLAMIFSAPSGFVAPAVVIEAAVIEESDTYLLSLRAGDTLLRNETRIFVDGSDRTTNFTEYSGSTAGTLAWEQWGAGESLALDLDGGDPPESVQVIYYDPQGDGMLLWDVGTSATVIPPTGLTPLAAFSANVTGGIAPLNVQFMDTSSNDPYAWEWSFGDGSLSAEQHPAHTYTSPGVYTVRLTAYNPDGSGSAVKTGYIHVSEGFEAGFNATPLSGNAPLTVNFTDLTTGAPTDWFWDFGDGTTSPLRNPVHVYASGGQYNVSLTASVGSLTDTERKEAYISVVELPLPVAWWRFDEASGTTALDSSGNNNDGTIEGGTPDRRAGACGTGLYFDGTTTWVSVPDDDTLSFNESFSFVGWFRPEIPENSAEQGSFRNYTQLIGKGSDDYFWNIYHNNYEIFLRVADGSISFESNEEGDFFFDEGRVSGETGLPLSFDEWVHLAVVIDGEEGSVYIDGAEQGTFSVLATPLQENANDVSIGRQIVTGTSYADFYYKGMMDELMLYGTALTPEQVAYLADTCTPSGNQSPVISFTATPVTGTSPLAVQFDSSVSGTAPFTYLWAFGDGDTSVDADPLHVYTSPGVYNVSLTVENSAGSTTETKYDYITVTGMPLPVAWWRFDEASGNTALDSSGNGNDGTIEGGAAVRRAGACGTGLYFDGTTTWVNVPDDNTLSFNDTFTFAGWFRPEQPALTYDTFPYNTQIIGKGYDNYKNWKGPHHNNYEIFLQVPDDRLWFEANGDEDSPSTEGFLSQESGLLLSYNDWFHLAVVVDGGTGTVYVDGIEEGNFPVSRTPLQENTEPVSIGQQMVSAATGAEFFYKGMMDELYLYGTALTADEVVILADACTPSTGDAPSVSFTGTPVTGDVPLTVQFTSTVTGAAPFTYLWNYGDGFTSTEADPLHTYADAGTYDVNLTVTNSYGTDTLERTAYINATEAVSAFAQYVVNENVFVYGQELSFAGDTVTGTGATIHITGSELNTADLNGGTSLAVSNIYVDGTISLDTGSASLGSETSPGSIYVNGGLNLRNGTRDIYGNVYVDGNCFLKDPVIHGTMYIDGDLELGTTPNLNDAIVYYTGSFTCPPEMKKNVYKNCIYLESVPGFTIPAMTMASPKSDGWYSSHGYVTGGELADNIKICADSYSAITNWSAPSSTEDVIIVAKSGDIVLTGMGTRIVTGVLFAPNGEVVFEGSSFEGLVIARDGFRVPSGGTAVTFKNMDQYISNPADYPF